MKKKMLKKRKLKNRPIQQVNMCHTTTITVIVQITMVHPTVTNITTQDISRTKPTLIMEVTKGIKQFLIPTQD